jgi:Acetyltransferase (GNAT) domain
MTAMGRANQPFAEAAAGAQLHLAPYDAMRSTWRGIASSFGGATLYHGERWLEVLRRTYGFDIVVASVRARGEIVAACLLASSKGPFRARLIGLPFSDLCPPLALNALARSALMAVLAENANQGSSIEIRGIDAPGPWQVVWRFENWERGLGTPVPEKARATAKNFRRNVSKSLNAGVCVDRGSTPEHMERFITLHRAARRRAGLPAQPQRFFENIRTVFGPIDDLKVWIATLNGTDLAAAVTLRERDRIYYKWSARALREQLGTGHLLVSRMIEYYAEDAAALDLGRADTRNAGLARFKRECGATAIPDPYSFLPRAPRQPSIEVLTGARAAAARVWRHLPVPICRAIESSLYGYLT